MMNRQVAIEQGRQPWLPSRDAEEVLVLHRYDMPLIGVIRQDGDLYLYRCIEGLTEASHLWAYTALREDELESLGGASPEGLDQAVEAAAADRPLVVALAHDDTGITASALITTPDRYKSLVHAASSALRDASIEVDKKLAHLAV
jgi:hypothetical protein